MAHFDGAKQGLAVWLWGIIVAIAIAIAIAIVIVIAILALAAGDQFNVLSRIEGVPDIPIDGSLLTTSGLIALAIAVLVPPRRGDSRR